MVETTPSTLFHQIKQRCKNVVATVREISMPICCTLRSSAGNKGSSNAQQAAAVTDCIHHHSRLLPCRRITKQITERSDDAQYSLGSIQRQLQSGSPVQSSLSLSLPSMFHRLFFFFGLPFSNFEDDRDIDRLPGGRPRRRSDVESLCREDDGRKREDGVEKLPPSPWQTDNRQTLHRINN